MLAGGCRHKRDEMCATCGKRPRHKGAKGPASPECIKCRAETKTQGDRERVSRTNTSATLPSGSTAQPRRPGESNSPTPTSGCERPNTSVEQDTDLQRAVEHERELVALIQQLERALANCRTVTTKVKIGGRTWDVPPDRLHACRDVLCAMLNASVARRSTQTLKRHATTRGATTAAEPGCLNRARTVVTGWVSRRGSGRAPGAAAVSSASSAGSRFDGVSTTSPRFTRRCQPRLREAFRNEAGGGVPHGHGRRKRHPWGESNLRRPEYSNEYSEVLTEREITELVDGRKTPQHGWCGGEPWLRPALGPHDGAIHGVRQAGDLTGQILVPDPVQAGLKRDASWRARGGDVVHLVLHEPVDDRLAVAA